MLSPNSMVLGSIIRFSTRPRPLQSIRCPREGSRSNSTTSTSAQALRRSYLYVPSASQRMLDKSVNVNSDVIIYDLEDSVSASEKDNARGRLRQFLDHEQNVPSPAKISVRVNDISTPHFVKDAAMIAASSAVRTLVLPKIHSAADLHYVSQTIHMARKGPGSGPLEIVASIESAKGLWNIGEIAQWASTTADIRLVALLFAAEDYCADTGISRTPSRQELLYTRSQVVNAAKAFSLQAIDMVCVNYEDPDYLQDECADAKRLGFNGKQAIHPVQLETINSSFLPSEQEIRRAAKIVEQMGEDTSLGAFGLETAAGGREMIDAPMLKQAMNTLRQAKAGGLAIPESTK
ncbi:citrate lyase beta subunit, partial [Pterulicium gracile]